MDGIGLDELADSFVRALRAEGKAGGTIRLYRQSVTMYRDWLTERGSPAGLDQLTRESIRDWLGHLNESREPGTVRTRFAGLRRFCNWLVEEGELAESPMAGLSPPEARDKPVPVLDDDELTALVRSCAGRAFEDRRDEALIRVLLDTGLRVSELCSLTVEDIDLDREMALVRGKGGKVRPIYFGAKTIRSLDRYLRERRRHRHAHLGAFWLTQRGALSTDGARERLRVRSEQAGLSGRLHPHRFRHTFAHDFLLAGGQGGDLKRLAGWSSDVMLARYGASGADVRAREATRRMRRGDRV